MSRATLAPRALFAAATLAGGCDGGDPCDGKSGLCLGLKISGSPATLDQLQIGVDALGQTLRDPPAPSRFSLPVKLALLLPPSAAGQTVEVSLVGMLDGNAVAQGSVSAMLPASGHVTRAATHAPGGVIAGDDDMGGVDAMPTPPLPEITTDGALTVYETESFSVTITGEDPTGLPFALSLPPPEMLPAGMTINVNGPSANITWTPDISQAGTYQIPVALDSTDPTHSILQNVTLTVLNGADPLPPSEAAATSYPHFSRVLGDFDKDGLGDLVLCEYTYTGSTKLRHYTATVYFGDASGFPASGPVPADRSRTWHFDAKHVGTSASDVAAPAQVPCIGADWDHDGNLDLVLADPDNDERGADTGKLYVVWGDGTRDLPDPVPAAGFVGLVDSNTPAGESLGGDNNSTAVYDLDKSLFAADINGDGWIDVGAIAPDWGPFIPPGQTLTYHHGKVVFWYGRKDLARATDAGPGIAASLEYTANPADNTATNKNCYGSTAITGVGDFDGDGGADQLLYEPNLHVENAGCIDGDQGGLRVLSGAGSMSKDFINFSTRAFGSASTTCDVNADAHPDLVVLFRPAGGVSSIYFYTAYPWTISSPLTLPAPQSASWRNLVCAPGFGEGSAILGIRSVGTPTVDAIDVLYGGTAAPTISTQIANPDPDTTFVTMEMLPIDAAVDLNGDGHAEALIDTMKYQGHAPPIRHHWILYGRPPR
jgi:hypothetical protein